MTVAAQMAAVDTYAAHCIVCGRHFDKERQAITPAIQIGCADGTRWLANCGRHSRKAVVRAHHLKSRAQMLAECKRAQDA